MKNSNVLTSFLLLWCLGLTGYLIYQHFRPAPQAIQTGHLEILDTNNQRVVILSNPANFPDPVIDGKTYKRAVSPGGMVFYNSDGNEVGGLALSKNDSLSLNAFILDYSTADALGMFIQENKNNQTHRAVFQINDKGRKIGEGKERLLLQNENGNAGLFIKDQTGKTVIELSVDSLGNPKILLPFEDENEVRENSTF